MLAFHDALTVVLLRGLAAETLEDRLICLLDLQDQRVVLIGTLQDDDPGTRADTADTDHLAGDIDTVVALQEP